MIHYSTRNTHRSGRIRHQVWYYHNGTKKHFRSTDPQKVLRWIACQKSPQSEIIERAPIWL